ncbi:unnamed protein product [Amoebophrya sp. A120]|nr:unnamed protein product [Amoebophrya sp. A120]|eukprot:GSA120T00023696001.1
MSRLTSPAFSPTKKPGKLQPIKDPSASAGGPGGAGVLAASKITSRQRHGATSVQDVVGQNKAALASTTPGPKFSLSLLRLEARDLELVAPLSFSKNTELYFVMKVNGIHCFTSHVVRSKEMEKLFLKNNYPVAAGANSIFSWHGGGAAGTIDDGDESSRHRKSRRSCTKTDLLHQWRGLEEVESVSIYLFRVVSATPVESDYTNEVAKRQTREGGARSERTKVAEIKGGGRQSDQDHDATESVEESPIARALRRTLQEQEVMLASSQQAPRGPAGTEVVVPIAAVACDYNMHENPEMLHDEDEEHESPICNEETADANDFLQGNLAEFHPSSSSKHPAAPTETAGGPDDATSTSGNNFLADFVSSGAGQQKLSRSSKGAGDKSLPKVLDSLGFDNADPGHEGGATSSEESEEDAAAAKLLAALLREDDSEDEEVDIEQQDEASNIPSADADDDEKHDATREQQDELLGKSSSSADDGGEDVGSSGNSFDAAVSGSAAGAQHFQLFGGTKEAEEGELQSDQGSEQGEARPAINANTLEPPQSKTRDDPPPEESYSEEEDAFDEDVDDGEAEQGELSQAQAQIQAPASRELLSSSSKSSTSVEVEGSSDEDDGGLNAAILGSSPVNATKKDDLFRNQNEEEEDDEPGDSLDLPGASASSSKNSSSEDPPVKSSNTEEEEEPGSFQLEEDAENQDQKNDSDDDEFGLDAFLGLGGGNKTTSEEEQPEDFFAAAFYADGDHNQEVPASPVEGASNTTVRYGRPLGVMKIVLKKGGVGGGSSLSSSSSSQSHHLLSNEFYELPQGIWSPADCPVAEPYAANKIEEDPREFVTPAALNQQDGQMLSRQGPKLKVVVKIELDEDYCSAADHFYAGGKTNSSKPREGSAAPLLRDVDRLLENVLLPSSSSSKKSSKEKTTSRAETSKDKENDGARSTTKPTAAPLQPTSSFQQSVLSAKNSYKATALSTSSTTTTIFDSKRAPALRKNIPPDAKLSDIRRWSADLRALILKQNEQIEYLTERVADLEGEERDSFLRGGVGRGRGQGGKNAKAKSLQANPRVTSDDLLYIRKWPHIRADLRGQILPSEPLEVLAVVDDGSWALIRRLAPKNSTTTTGSSSSLSKQSKIKKSAMNEGEGFVETASLQPLPLNYELREKVFAVGRTTGGADAVAQPSGSGKSKNGEDESLALQDFFHDMDQDRDKAVTKKEFLNAMRKLNIDNGELLWRKSVPRAAGGKSSEDQLMTYQTFVKLVSSSSNQQRL